MMNFLETAIECLEEAEATQDEEWTSLWLRKATAYALVGLLNAFTPPKYEATYKGKPISELTDEQAQAFLDNMRIKS